MNRRTFVVSMAVAIFFALSCGVAQDLVPLPVLPDSLAEISKAYLAENLMSPEEYVISKFGKHDIVILGEQHRARQDPLLVQSLIPRLHAAGIYVLCTEFGRREDQPLIDSLLSATEWNEKLARRITLQQFVHWPYREYVDIYKAAWQVNRELDANERPFRILALAGSPEWWHIQTAEDRSDHQVLKQVWHGEGEEDWAKLVLQEVVDKGDKALAYCGINHGFTEFLQPKVWNDSCRGFVKDRFGRYLFDAIGKRVITIYLHNYWESVDGYDAPLVYPADGFIDALMAEIGAEGWPVGFDTKGTPFGDLTGETSIYRNCYEHFTLGDFCDGYIFQMPFTQFEPITCIEGFYNEGNLDYVRRNSPVPSYRNATLEQLEAGCENIREEKAKAWSRFR